MREKKSPKEQSKFDAFIDRVKLQIKQKHALMNWVAKHRAAFESLDFEPQFYSSQVDFDNLSHRNVLKVIRAFPGRKWTKTPNGNQGRVDYVSEADGMTIRCWKGEPPPSCKLVAKEVHIPARTETVYELVCPRKTLQAAA